MDMETAVASTAESELKTPSPNPPKPPLEETPDKARTYLDIQMDIACINIENQTLQTHMYAEI